MLEPEFRFVDDSEAVEECREFGEAGNHVSPVRRVRLGDLEPVGDAEVLEDGRVEAERDDLGDEVGGDGSDEVLLSRVECGPALGEIGLGEADVACFFEHVELADLAGDRVEPSAGTACQDDAFHANLHQLAKLARIFLRVAMQSALKRSLK